MSLANLDSGGGGGGSGDGGSDGGGSGGGGLSPRVIREIVEDVLQAIFPRRFLRDPRTYIIGTVIAWVVDRFIVPIFRGFAQAGAAIIQAILAVFLGRDLTWAAEGSIGLADIPLWFLTNLIEAGAPIGSGILTVLDTLNIAIETVALQAGPAAPVVATGLYGAVALSVGYVTWSIIQVIDIPGIQLSGIVSVATLPFRKLLAVIR